MSNIHKRIRIVKTPSPIVPLVKEALRFVPLERMVSSSVDQYTICKLHLITLLSCAKTNGRLVPLVQVEE